MTDAVRFALFCKSFSRDIRRFGQLYRSILQFDQSQFPLLVSVPNNELNMFRQQFTDSRVEFIADEDVLGRHIKQGWRVQQEVKLASWRVDFADAWMVVDSDYYFIRPFSLADFIDENNNLAMIASVRLHRYYNMTSDLDMFLNTGNIPNGQLQADLLRQETANMKTIAPWQPWIDYFYKAPLLERLDSIQHIYKRPGPTLNYMPGPIWTKDTFISLEREFLQPRNLSIRSLIRYSPWEAVWVGEWEVARGAPQRFLREPYFIHFVEDQEIESARAAGYNAQRFSQGYLGINLAAGHQEIEEL